MPLVTASSQRQRGGEGTTNFKVMVGLFIVKHIGPAGQGCRASSVHSPGPCLWCPPSFHAGLPTGPPSGPSSAPPLLGLSQNTEQETGQNASRAASDMSLGTTPTMQVSPLLTPGLIPHLGK